MPEKDEFPKTFCCPNCKSTETLGEVIVKPERDAGRLKPDDFVSLEQTLIPAVVPNAIIGVTIPAIKVHSDICWKCGMRHVTRVERTRMRQATSEEVTQGIQGSRN